jgi:hypothetical protein
VSLYVLDQVELLGEKKGATLKAFFKGGSPSTCVTSPAHSKTKAEEHQVDIKTEHIKAEATSPPTQHGKRYKRTSVIMCMSTVATPETLAVAALHAYEGDDPPAFCAPMLITGPTRRMALMRRGQIPMSPRRPRVIALPRREARRRR